MSSTPQVFLVGHCGPDTSYLRLAVKKAFPNALIHAAHSDQAVEDFLARIPGDEPQPLLLVNRALEPGFSQENGVDLVEGLHRKYPHARLMLVSNFPDAQDAAVAKGALRGFGKRDIGSSALTGLLQAAILQDAAR